MSLFRRRRTAPEETEPRPDAATEPVGDPDVVAADVSGPSGQPTRPGPYDEAEVTDGMTRVDLGALRVPPRPGMQLRLELEEKTQRVIAATIGLAGSTVQLQAFAAPRSEGIWDEIRSEIATQVTSSGGTADEIDGSFGQELLARLPVRTSDGRTGHRPARFIGVDGPRWFLRGVFSGPAAADEAAAGPLEEVVRQTVVVRGTEAMAPRDLLPLTMPATPSAGPAGQDEPQVATGGAGDTGETP